MKNTIQSLREYQSQVDLSKLEKSISISIDRLTVIFDSDNCSLRRIFWELINSIDSIIQEFSIQVNLKEDYFTLYKMINEDSINLIFFQLSTYGGYQVIRLDFTPNSLKELGRGLFFINLSLFFINLSLFFINLFLFFYLDVCLYNL